MIINDASKVVSDWGNNLEHHLWSSITLVELSITLLVNIYSTGFTHADRNIFIVQATVYTWDAFNSKS